MTRKNEAFQPRNDFARQTGFVSRLNRMLFPWIGPPPLGPYDTAPERDRTAAPCPLCGLPMADHEFDRSVPDRPTRFYCPDSAA